MASPVLGIDLGTTNSVVAYADEQRVRVLRDDSGRLITPSTVSFLADGTTLVGSAARDQRLLDVENTVFSVKRLIGRPFRSAEVRRAIERLPFKLEEGSTGGVVVRIRNETFSLPEISSFILRHLRNVAEHAVGQPCLNAVITVPANFNELQRMATRDAGRIAGLNVLRILNEPTAAALAYGYRAQQQQRIAVYDFGGGTFDISILELSGDVIEVVATAGDTHLGGDDLDRALADRMVAAFKAQHGLDLRTHVQQYERITMAAEWLKCQLSELEAAEAVIREVAIVNGSPLDLTFKLSRAELYELCAPFIQRTFTICEDALRLAAVRPSQLDGVILVGGQTRTPKVREMVSEYFGMDPKYSVDPDLAVAQGAALQGYALSGVPAVERSRRVGRTLAGAATVPPPPQLDDIFEDEPTRVATPRESDRAKGPAPKPSDAPFDDLPTTITQRDPDFEPTKVGELRAAQPMVRPDGAPGTHASTLSGVGAPTPPPRRPESEPVTVSSEDVPYVAFTVDSREPSIEFELLHDSVAELVEEDSDVLHLPTVHGPTAKTLAETPSAKAGIRPSRLPPDARTSTAPHAAGSASGALVEGPRRTVHAQPPASALNSATEVEQDVELPAVLREPESDDDADPSTTLMERPRAKAKTRPPGARSTDPAPSAPSREPIRTHSMARLLASQGHIERALSIYGELLSQAPTDPALNSEARALRTKLTKKSVPDSQSSPSALGPPPLAAAPRSAASARDPRSNPAPAKAAGFSLDAEERARATQIVQTAGAAWTAGSAAKLSPAARAVPNLPAVSAPRSPSPILAPALQDAESQFPAPPSIAPLLLDVTPHTLSVETVGGFCEPIIERNAPIPTEQTRVFSTSRDSQVTVSVRVCQGESRRTEDNQVLGQIDLLGLRQARRGEVRIAVTFVIDADGTLNVRAIDEGTGYGQELEVNLVGAIGVQEIERMRARHR